MAQTKQNAVWELFSGIPERVAHGAADYEWRTEGLSSVISTLYTHYRLEGIQMPYTVQDYLREVTLEHLDTLTLEERMKGLTVEELLQSVSLEAAMRYLCPEHAEELIKIYYSQKWQKKEQNNGKKE